MQAGGGGGGALAADAPAPAAATPAAAAAAPSGEHAHRSWSSRLPTTVIFHNSTQRTVEYAWLSFQGERTSYGSLAPGERAPPMYTWTAHPWVFTDPADPGVLLVAGDDCPTYYAPPHVRPGPAPFPPVPLWHAELHPGVRARHLAGTPLMVAIHEASRQAWAPALHALAPPGFRAAARALLLCHHRLAAAPLVQARRQGQWHGRLRSSAARQRRCTLGDLHQDLLTLILAAAAPSLPVLRRPALPEGLPPSDLPPGALQQLFSAGEGAGG